MNETPVAERPPYLLALAVVAATLALYIATLAPTTQFWDTSEYIAAARVLGIPHPPGNPLFTLMAHVWGLLPLAAGYARRINLFAATTSAVAAGCWFLISERWLRPIVPAPWPRRAAAFASALVSATAFTVWNQSVVNEKVYTLSLFSIALILWLIVRWDDQPEGEAHDHYLLLIVYLLALTSTNHMMGVLVGWSVIVLLFPPLMTRRAATDEGRITEWMLFLSFAAVFGVLGASGLESKAVLIAAAVVYLVVLLLSLYTGNWRFAVALLLVAVVGVSVNTFLLIRSGHFPPINEGEPTTLQALWAVLTRQQYGKPPITERQADFVAQVLLWVQYFRWQWGRDLADGLQAGLAVIFFFLGGLGAWRHFKADRRQAWAMLTLVLFFTLILIFYLNFKYGFSQYLPRQLPREVRERDYFFICSFAIWGIWVGMGLATLMEWFQDGLRDRVPNEATRWAYATPILAVALIPLWSNHLTASRAGETLARDFAADVLNSVEPYGILVTAGDNDTFPLWYAQEVEAIRPDVTVINLSLANTDWYLRQIQRRQTPEYDAAHGPALYRGGTWPHPTGKLLDMTDAQLAGLQLYYVLNQRQTVDLAGIPVTLDPTLKNPLPTGEGYLERADVVVLTAIKDQLGKRPIYFSRTVGTYADEYGLTPYLEGQGFVRKLLPKPITPSDSVVVVGGFGYVNVKRSTALAFDVYHFGAATRVRPRGWVDRPSEGILGLYGLTYAALGQALQGRDAQGALRAAAIADSVNKNTSFARLPIGSLPQQ